MEEPKIQKEIDWSRVIQSAIHRFSIVLDSQLPLGDENSKQFMFEEVMKAVFGKDYFTWENKQY